jgi:hypothetical protein
MYKLNNELWVNSIALAALQPSKRLAEPDKVNCRVATTVSLVNYEISSQLHKYTVRNMMSFCVSSEVMFQRRVTNCVFVFKFTKAKHRYCPVHFCLSLVALGLLIYVSRVLQLCSDKTLVLLADMLYANSPFL